MKTHCGWCFCIVLAGCGSAATIPDGGDGDLGAMRDLGSSDGAPSDGAAGDLPAGDQSPGDGGSSLAAHPPAGSKRCGQGTFTPADIAAACKIPSFALDQGQKLPRRCDGVSIVGGAWEVWCSPGSVYLFIRYDQITSTGKYPACMGFVSDRVDYGWDDVSDGTHGLGGGMTVTTDAPPPSFFDQTHGVDAAATATVMLGGAGNGTLFLVGEFNDTCGGAGTQAVIGAASVTWSGGPDA